jgi:hypothetical protein
MLLGCLFPIAITPKLHPERIESKRLAVRIDSGSLLLTNLHEGTGSMRSDVYAALQFLLKTLLVNSRLELPGSPLDRPEGYRQASPNSIPAQEQDSSRHGASDQQKGDGSEQDDAESESGQHPRQQEPDSRERENATAQLLAID